MLGVGVQGRSRQGPSSVGHKNVGFIISGKVLKQGIGTLITCQFYSSPQFPYCNRAINNPHHL